MTDKNKKGGDDIDWLNNSAVYNMTLGSKELFHSNFWAWFMNKSNYKFVKVFFDDIDITQIDCIKREFKNCDITIIMKNKDVYIIENKLKSLPNEYQLATYENKHRGHFVKGVVTGLEDPKFVNLQNWRFMPYSKISTEIKSQFIDNSQQSGTFECELLKEYCCMIGKINDVVCHYVKKMPNNLVYDAGLKLKSIRLDDIYKKLKASDFVESFSKREKEIEKMPNDYELEKKTGYSNGNAIIDIDWIKKNNIVNTKIDRIGIQIQGNQYRRFVVRFCKYNTKNLFDEYHNSWFGNKEGSYLTLPDNESNEVRVTGMKGLFCKYETNKYTFVYQYWNIEKNDNCTEYDTLIDIIIKDLETAKDIIERKN